MSAIILTVIVLAWAVVLVPVLLSRHDAADEARAMDRFNTAMRVLSRRTGATADRDRPVGSGDRRYVVMPRRPRRPPHVVVNGTSRYAPSASGLPAGSAAAGPPAAGSKGVGGMAAASRGASSKAAGSAAAGRRRRVALVLVALAVTTAVLAVTVSPLLWAGQALADLLLAAYGWQVRRVVARARPARTVEAAAPAPLAGASGYARAVEPPRFDLPSLPDHAVVIERQQDGSWRPVPVPLPTYLTAPVVSPAPAASAATAPARAVQTPAPEPRRRAVND